MSATTRVSVLIPVFNSAPYLREALQSICAQSFPDFEIIAINDGSTDNSSDILRAFAAVDNRLRLLERPNKGLVETRNELLNEARGDLIAWMDSDDRSHPDRLIRQVVAFDSDPTLVCLGTNIQQLDPEGRPLGFEFYPQEDAAIRFEQARGSGFRFASTMQRRSVALTAGGFRHPFRIGEDLDFLLRVAEHGRLANLEEVLYSYRQHLANTCSAHGLQWPQTRDIILELARERRELGGDRLQRGEAVDLPPAMPRADIKLAPFVLLNWAQGADAAGDRPRALRYVLRSIGMAPLSKAGWRQLAKMLLGKS